MRSWAAGRRLPEDPAVFAETRAGIVYYDAAMNKASHRQPGAGRHRHDGSSMPGSWAARSASSRNNVDLGGPDRFRDRQPVGHPVARLIAACRASLRRRPRSRAGCWPQRARRGSGARSAVLAHLRRSRAAGFPRGAAPVSCSPAGRGLTRGSLLTQTWAERGGDLLGFLWPRCSPCCSASRWALQGGRGPDRADHRLYPLSARLVVVLPLILWTGIGIEQSRGDLLRHLLRSSCGFRQVGPGVEGPARCLVHARPLGAR